MAKVLRVIDPFFVMELGDTFTLSEDGESYVSKHNEEFHNVTKDEKDLTSSYSSTFVISTKWAKQLIEDGYLEEVTETKKESSFVNVFDEINTLIDKYQNELSNIDTDMKDTPECLKVEKTVVLNNIIKVLNHLKTLRK